MEKTKESMRKMFEENEDHNDIQNMKMAAGMMVIQEVLNEKKILSTKEFRKRVSKFIRCMLDVNIEINLKNKEGAEKKPSYTG